MDVLWEYVDQRRIFSWFLKEALKTLYFKYDSTKHYGPEAFAASRLPGMLESLKDTSETNNSVLYKIQNWRLTLFSCLNCGTKEL